MPGATLPLAYHLPHTDDGLLPIDPAATHPSGWPVIGRESDPAATLAWAQHVAAGRIGVTSPPPATTPGGDYRLAGLERILGIGPAATHGASR